MLVVGERRLWGPLGAEEPRVAGTGLCSVRELMVKTNKEKLTPLEGSPCAL